MSLYRNTINFLNSAETRPKKNIGQNFLIDQNIMDIIVESAELSKNDIVVEIGSGTGLLTKKLASSSKKVFAVELDDKLFRILQTNCQTMTNIIPIHEDILKLNLRDLVNKEKIKIVGNLPYYITTPIIIKVLEESRDLNIQMILIMVQKEVALRMIASPGNKDYGALSIFINYRTKAEIVKYVPASCFYPKPKVDSAIVRMYPQNNLSVKPKDEELFFKIVRSAFQYRRKTLRNAIIIANQIRDRYIPIDKFDNAIQSLNFDAKIRGEELSLEDFINLANNIVQDKGGSELE